MPSGSRPNGLRPARAPPRPGDDGCDETRRTIPMSHPAAIPAPHDIHAEHEHGGFISTYVFSLDHKMIGKQFLFMALFMMIFGGLFAMLVRWQLASPVHPVPGFH